MNTEETRPLVNLTRIREEVLPIDYVPVPEPTVNRRRCCTGGFFAGFSFGLLTLPMACCLPLERKQKWDFTMGVVAGFALFLLLLLLFLVIDYYRGGRYGRAFFSMFS